MDRAVRSIAATGKAWGITWWCTHNLDPKIKDFWEDVEYGNGLLDMHNRPTPLGKKYSALAAELRNTTRDCTSRHIALVVPDTGLTPMSATMDWTYALPYMRLVEKGERPAIVLESRANDSEYLRQRGITKLIRLSEVAI